MRSNRNCLFFIIVLLGCTALAAQLLAAGRRYEYAAPGKARAGLTGGATATRALTANDAVLAKAYRFESAGWIYVHLEGSPHDIGYQHGYLLGPEIADAYAALSLQMTHNTQRDQKTGEIAQFELGLKRTKLYRTTDGIYVGSNFPSDPDVMRDDTSFDPKNMASSPNARHARWDQLVKENRGRIDTAMAQAFLSDHYDTYTKTEGANHRTLCGHGDASTEGDSAWGMRPYEPMGAVQGKVVDSKMAANMSFIARIGHPCGTNFDAAKFLHEHPEFNWQSPVMRDMNAGPWTQFCIGQTQPQK